MINVKVDPVSDEKNSNLSEIFGIQYIWLEILLNHWQWVHIQLVDGALIEMMETEKCIIHLKSDYISMKMDLFLDFYVNALQIRLSKTSIRCVRINVMFIFLRNKYLSVELTKCILCHGKMAV